MPALEARLRETHPTAFPGPEPTRLLRADGAGLRRVPSHPSHWSDPLRNGFAEVSRSTVVSGP